MGGEGAVVLEDFGRKPVLIYYAFYVRFHVYI